MSSTPENFKPIYKSSTNTLAVVLSVVLTANALLPFPKLLLSKVWTNNLHEIRVTKSNLLQDKIESHNFVTAAVKRVGASVVRIDTERTIANPFADLLFDNPFFRDFFGEDILEQVPREYRQKGQGSGFIIDRQGIILTNAHVVSGVDRVKVSLRDGRTFEGKVRGNDRLSDLAVVKIEGKNLPTAPLGSSSELEVGDWAIAVGNPLGLDNTVTLGIISTLNRSSLQVGIPHQRLNFIQTDAAINPGNSGGPLLNARGEVIGINTAIRAGAEGIGFAIPIDNAKAVKDRLIEGETIPYPYIGMQLLTLNPDIARQINREPNADIFVPEIRGILIVGVLPESPAMVAGLRRGDVITAIEGTTMVNAAQLQDLVDRSQIGQPMKISIRRGEQTQQRTVILQDIPEVYRFGSYN